MTKGNNLSELREDAFPSFLENSFMAFLVHIQVLIRETIDREVPKGD